jgi:primase-polymerase (primpol)-like protein
MKIGRASFAFAPTARSLHALCRSDWPEMPAGQYATRASGFLALPAMLQRKIGDTALRLSLSCAAGHQRRNAWERGSRTESDEQPADEQDE